MGREKGGRGKRRDREGKREVGGEKSEVGEMEEGRIGERNKEAGKR